MFEGQLDGKLVALDAKTGAVVWSIQAERWEEGFTITSAPLYYDGLLISGFAGAERGVRGRVKAFDAKTGKLRWTFYPVPAPGERGSETWPKNELWKDGGGTVWQTPAVDPELGLIFFSTSNPGPDFNGAVRAGDNLYTSSMVALDAKTGVYRWHFQQVHHDLWDYDSGNPVVLFDLAIDGKPRKGIAEASKTGWVYILDRTNRQAADRHRRAAGRAGAAAAHLADSADPARRLVRAAVDRHRARRLLARERRAHVHAVLDRLRAREARHHGRRELAAELVRPVQAATCSSARRIAPACSAPGRSRPIVLPRAPSTSAATSARTRSRALGTFTAIDLHTNKIAWQQQWPEPCYSGSVVTAGGLVFVGRNDGRLTALDSSDGRKLWEFQTGAGMNSTASVFEHKGKQYVVAYSGGSVFAHSAKGDSVWLFALDGTLDAVPPGKQ